MNPAGELQKITRFMIAAAVVAVLVFIGLALIAPFDVPLYAIYEGTEGGAVLVTRLDIERNYDELDKILTIEAGQSVWLEEDESGRIEVIEGSNAYAYLTAPAHWTLLEAERQGALIDHLLQNDDATYKVVIEQTQGVIVYDFSQSDPPLEDIDIEIRMLDGRFVPTTPCFQAMAPTQAAPGDLVTIPCWDESQQQSQQIEPESP